MRDSPAPAYLIVGDDPYLASEAIDKTISGVPELAVSEFGPAAEVSAIFEALTTPPMFGDVRVVLVRDADELPAAALREIEAYLENPSPDASLVLVSKKPLPKVAFQVKKVGRVVEAARGKRTDIFAWLREEAKSRGLKPSAEGPAALVEAVGEERLALAHALDELALSLGDGARLGGEEVRRQFKERTDARVFGFIDAVAGRQGGPALELLHRLVRVGEAPQALFWMLVRHFRMLILAAGAAGAGGSSQEISQMLGLPGWRAEKLARQARNFNSKELNEIFQLLAEADRKMKKSEEPELLTLERTVVAIAK